MAEGVQIVKSEVVPVDSIRPNDYNPNKMPGSVYAFLKKSIAKWGFLQAVIVTTDNVIIDGEHRWKAVKEQGGTEIEIKRVDMTEEEAKASTINFNQTKGEADEEMLGRLIRSLHESMGADKLQQAIVLDTRRINNLIRRYEESQNPATDTHVEDPTLETTIQHGDLIYLGGHRLMCGDATNKDDVGMLVVEKSALTITDPPYNVGYEYRDYKDNLTATEYREFIRKYVENCLEYSAFVIITPGNGNLRYYYQQFDVIDQTVWNKKYSGTGGHVCRAMVTEPILYIGKKPANKFLDTDYMEIMTDRQDGLREKHSCPKPVQLFKNLVVVFTVLGDTVIDLFGGSGTTLMVCEQNGRFCSIMERDPVYCQNIVNRWEAYTGKKAETADGEQT